MKTVTKIACAALLLGVVYGCAVNGSEESYVGIGDGLIRTDDTARGVSCYHRPYTNTGLSCVYTGIGIKP